MRATTQFNSGAIVNTLLLAIALSFLLLAPEIWFSHFTDFNFEPAWRPREIITVLLICLLIAGSKSRPLGLFSFMLISAVQLSELWHMSYFGSFYSPSQVILLFEDVGEITESAQAAWRQMLPPLIATGLCIALAVSILKKLGTSVLQSRAFDILLIMTLVLPVIGASREANSRKFEPDAQTLAIKNGLYAISFFLGNDLPGRLTGRYQPRQFLPYEVTRLPQPDMGHIILILGESTSSSHWHLYGYEKSTTPRLDELSNLRGFSHRIGIATAVTTRSAVPMLLNSQREPDNTKHLRDGTGSLFRLAKLSGYQTAFVSTQIMDKISSYVSAPAIDHWQEAQQLESLPGRLDHKLLSAVSKLPIAWDRPTFIVVNPRCCHSPYEAFVAEKGPFFSKSVPETAPEYRRASYDDAMLYLDELITDLIQHIDHARKQVKRPLPITFIMLSDHGEKLGEDNQYGHNHLDMTTALTPFFVYSPDGTRTDAQKILQDFPCAIPHYAGSLLIARMLGYRIDNPNQESDIYYINGTDISGRAGFFDYKLSDAQTKLACP